MFNYLNTPGAADQMSPSMPMAVPGAPPPSTTGMTAPVPSGAPMPPMPPSAGPAPGVIAPSGPITQSMMPPPAPPNPADMKYINETQTDGSVLLRIANADGTPGPVVKIVPAPKQPKVAGQK